MKQVKWGIIGLGGIASKFADGFQFTKNARLFAISSKNENKLLEFKNKFQIDENYCFSNYNSLLECKDLDMVYIALPHSFHHEWVIKSIEKRKNILVEKPATVNFSQMENIKNNLKKKNIFFSEAFMYRYHPQIPKIVDLLKNKKHSKKFGLKAKRAVFKPRSQLKIGLNCKNYFSSAMDSSDGLSTTLNEMSNQSGRRFIITSKPSEKDIFHFANLNRLDVNNLIFNGGEEYEIVATTNKSNFSLFSFKIKHGINF